MTPSPRRDGSAELSSNEGGDPSTGFLRQRLIFRFREDADQGLGTGRAHQDPATSRPFPVEFLDFSHDFLGAAARRIINEVRGINRVVYDITSKPPGTIEWE